MACNWLDCAMHYYRVRVINLVLQGLVIHVCNISKLYSFNIRWISFNEGFHLAISVLLILGNL